MLEEIPTEIWTEVALEIIDVCDLVAVDRAFGFLPPLASGATFVARRVLTDAELDWFAARAIPVTLLVAKKHIHGYGELRNQFLTNSHYHRFRCVDAYVWTLNGKPHRENDLPTIEFCNGWWKHGQWKHGQGAANEWGEWYFQGRLHRNNDLPAVLLPNGDRQWWFHGKRHRENGKPACEYANGDRAWYFHDQLHRDDDLPAVINAERGVQIWWHRGILHREGGRPAIVRNNGTCEWWVDGKQVGTRRSARLQAAAAV